MKEGWIVRSEEEWQKTTAFRQTRLDTPALAIERGTDGVSETKRRATRNRYCVKRLNERRRPWARRLREKREKIARKCGRFWGSWLCEGEYGTYRVTHGFCACLSLKFSKPRTMFHWGQSSCRYRVSVERIWFSTARSVPFRELERHSPVSFPLLFLHQPLELVLVVPVRSLVHAKQTE